MIWSAICMLTPTTSGAPVQRTINRGRRSIIALNSVRASS
jgi:hypothetical protein